MLDEETRTKMRQPRCGFRDILQNTDPNAPQKYSHLGEFLLEHSCSCLVLFVCLFVWGRGGWGVAFFSFFFC